mmetsp:Transcript_14216/g.32247  ORF Transcript_14216/g.32247 Transcript_14216/m.32247 type:complete len:245 (-) Transcript_14216:171-905(-)
MPTAAAPPLREFAQNFIRAFLDTKPAHAGGSTGGPLLSGPFRCLAGVRRVSKNEARRRLVGREGARAKVKTGRGEDRGDWPKGSDTPVVADLKLRIESDDDPIDVQSPAVAPPVQEKMFADSVEGQPTPCADRCRAQTRRILPVRRETFAQLPPLPPPPPPDLSTHEDTIDSWTFCAKAVSSRSKTSATPTSSCRRTSSGMDCDGEETPSDINAFHLVQCSEVVSEDEGSDLEDYHIVSEARVL